MEKSLNTSHRDPRAYPVGSHARQTEPREQEAPDFRNMAGQACPGFSSVRPEGHLSMLRGCAASSGDPGGGGGRSGVPLPRPLLVMIPG